MKKILGKSLLALSLLSTIGYSVDNSEKEKYVNSYRSHQISDLNGKIYDTNLTEKERKESAEKLLTLYNYLHELKSDLPKFRKNTHKTIDYLIEAFNAISFNQALVKAKREELTTAIQTPILVPTPPAPIVVPAPVTAPVGTAPLVPVSVLPANQTTVRQWNQEDAVHVNKYDAKKVNELIDTVKNIKEHRLTIKKAAAELFDLYTKAGSVIETNQRGDKDRATIKSKKIQEAIKRRLNLDRLEATANN